MAYISQQDKKTLAPAIKQVLKKYGLKGSISIKNLMSLRVTVTAGRLDLIGAANLATNVNRPHNSGYYQANPYGNNEKYKDINLDIFNFYTELKKAMKGGLWFDKSDSMTDYFHTAYYLEIHIGRSDKPYQLTS